MVLMAAPLLAEKLVRLTQSVKRVVQSVKSQGLGVESRPRDQSVANHEKQEAGHRRGIYRVQTKDKQVNIVSKALGRYTLRTDYGRLSHRKLHQMEEEGNKISNQLRVVALEAQEALRGTQVLVPA